MHSESALAIHATKSQSSPSLEPRWKKFCGESSKAPPSVELSASNAIEETMKKKKKK